MVIPGNGAGKHGRRAYINVLHRTTATEKAGKRRTLDLFASVRENEVAVCYAKFVS